MRLSIIGLVIWFLLSAPIQAEIVERIIYAGDTPLASSCTVTQTGPMELTAAACRWTTTGQARVVRASKVPDLANEIAAGRVQMMPDGKRVRGWLRNKDGSIIEKSRTRVLPSTVLNIVAGNEWVVYLADGPGVTAELVLQLWESENPAGVLNYLIMPFDVPAGTVDLNNITIEVFTVRPNFPLAEGLFEK